MTGPREATLTSEPLTIAPISTPRLMVPGRFRRAVEIAGDLLGLIGIAFCIPAVIVAIGLPIALGIRLLLWIVGGA
jgi:hypothetical protein